MNKLTFTKITGLAVTLISLVACKDSNSIDGIWYAPAYGGIYVYTWEQNAYTSQHFHITSNYCIAEELVTGITPEELNKTVRQKGDGLEIVEEGRFRSPGIEYQRLNALPYPCEFPLTLKGGSEYKFNPVADFNVFWETIQELHLKERILESANWMELYAEAEAELRSVSTERGLFDLFVNVMDRLGDGHGVLLHGDLSKGVRSLLADGEILAAYSTETKLDLESTLEQEFYTESGLDPESDGFDDALEFYIESQFDIVQESILDFAETEIQSAADDAFIWFRTQHNLGYVFISSMSDYGDNSFDIQTDVAIAETIMDEIMGDFKDVDGLIVDLRFNDGGDDEVSLAIASRLISETTHAYSKQARFDGGRTPLVDVMLEPAGEEQFVGPVVILTSKQTASAAEVFVLSLNNRSNLTIIGEPSLGAFSTILEKRVASDIAFGFSNEFYYSAEGDWFEGAGIPVDIDIPFASKEQRENSEDLGLETAIATLGGKLE